MDELLRRHYDQSSACVADKQEAIQRVNHDREREVSMRRAMGPRLVRRLDAGFARSNTVHPDTGKALYAICHASGARTVFETGTYWGFSTAYLASALRDRRCGKVFTFDLYPRAGKHIPKDLMPFVEMHRGKPAAEMMPPVLARVTPELFFQDSRHDYEGVRGELEVIAPHMAQNSVIMFHDFVAPEVRRAAADVLAGYTIYVLDSADPQQVGVAIRGGD